MDNKKISVLVPCFNEEENVIPLAQELMEMFKKSLPSYDYEIVFIDNDSTDTTRERLEALCSKFSRIKAIFNAKNFGQFNSPVYGMMQTTGDCVIPVCADFQDPIEMLPKLVAEWEKGYKIVCAIKTSSQENKIMRFFRTCYYKLVKKMSKVEQIEHFTGFGLYDRSFINVLKELDDPTPFIRGIVAELGFRRKDIEYEQAQRRAGKTSNNWFSLYDAAMLSFTSYTKTGLRFATVLGAGLSALSIFSFIVCFILKLAMWSTFSFGTAAIVTGLFLFCSLQMFFIGLLGEYVMNINTRVMNRPLVIEEKRINFEEEVKR
ncbi:MAG: glycosyltransferase family 2 protein [Clostridia bacterium]|nr:glycosyltransferase family 2 protein [Clostridia bacterium]